MACSCGPRYFPKAIRCWLSKDFNEACEEHDQLYFEKILSRKQADDILLRRMIFIVHSKNLDFKCTLRACSFYSLVRVFGFISWRFF